MDVEAPSNAPAGSTGGEPLRRTLSRPDDKKKDCMTCKWIGFLFCYGLVYAVGEFFLVIIYAIVMAVATAAKVRMDVGIWCGIWFVLLQAWGVTLGVITERVTVRWNLEAAAPVAPKPAADQTRPTPKQLNRKFASWVEHDSQSANAVLFNSLGMWLSPQFPTALMFFSVMMLLMVPGLSLVYSGAFCLAFGVMTLPVFGTALLLFHGRRFTARILFAFANWGVSLACIGEAAVLLARGRSGYLIVPLLLIAVCFGVVIGVFVCLFPRFHSWRIATTSVLIHWYGQALVTGIFFAKRFDCPDGKCTYQSEVRRLAFASMCSQGAITISIIVLAELKYRATMRHAHEMSRTDAKSYDEVWKTFVADETKLKALSGLADTYKAAMAGAEKRSKRQAVPSVGDLFEDAFALRSLVLAKAEAIGGDAGAVVYGSTKTVARAFQKAWRSYAGDYRRLCDVVRVSIAYETIDELTACLERIVADDELELIPQGLEKCRFDPEYDPYAGQFVGYRDLQLGATFKSAETRAQGLDQHIIEIQLHLRVFEAIKKGHVTVALPVVARMALLRTGSGHRTYVSCRNLRCS